MPDETPEQTEAREVLRRFVAKWWACYQERKAWEWLASTGGAEHTHNKAAIADCVRRMKACTYWSWTRGSRIFFWKFGEFLEDMRDGSEFWHLCPAPKGFPHNHPPPSREAEIEARKKVFKLKFQWYLEHGFVDLTVPRFSITKVLVDGVVLDIRVVWDSSSNGHNETLWAPGFMLDDFLDVIEHVFKWLSVPVKVYLLMGSPAQDYALPASSFTKSLQGDVDVSSMFMNFQAHHKERHALGVRDIETHGDGSYEPHTFLRYSTLHFGGKCSPYLACQAELRILEACMGNRHDENNEWQWEEVWLNLMFAAGYDCSLPRVILLRKDGEAATRKAVYVDDIHPTGRDPPGDERTRRAQRQLKSRMNSRGNQADDAKS